MGWGKGGNMREIVPCPTCDGMGEIERVTSPETPEGFKEVDFWSSYYGSHSEYGEGDRHFRVAIPEGEEFPTEFQFSHGHYRAQWEDWIKFPASAIVAEDGDEQWVPMAETFDPDYVPEN
jgi:hypothetical protein